jgi:aspartate aminotransferase
MLSDPPIRPFSRRMDSIAISSTSATVNAVAERKAAGLNLVDFGAGEPHFATPQHIKEAAYAAIARGQTKYTAVPGTAELRESILWRHNEDFGSDYRFEEVIACPGGKYALFAALQVVVDEGDEVILPVPYWVSFKDMVHFAGGKCVFVDTTDDDFALTAQKIARAVTSRTKAIILNYPNNPTGAVLAREHIAEIVDMAARRNIWIISDECYAYLVYSGNPFSAGELKPAKDHMIIVGSLSKTYAMTGWRLGYALAPAPVIAAVEVIQSQAISCACAVTQAAAVAALTGPQECVREMVSEYKRLRDRTVAAVSEFPGVRTTVPGGAFYLFPDISEQLRAKGQSAPELCAALLDHGVATVPGTGFGAANHIRMSFACAERELASGLEAMRKFFSN